MKPKFQFNDVVQRGAHLGEIVGKEKDGDWYLIQWQTPGLGTTSEHAANLTLITNDLLREV